LPKKIAKDGKDMKDGVWTIFLYENMSCPLLWVYRAHFWFVSMSIVSFNPCNFGSMSASVMVFVLIGFFSNTELLFKDLKKIEFRVGTALLKKVDFFPKMTSSSKNPPFWIFEKSFFYKS
jgi:hypothetical protein